MGTSSERCDGPSCCFGLNYVTESGKHFLSYLSINNLAVVTTFFKKNRYATWIYPRSKKNTKLTILLLIKKCVTVILMLVLHQSCYCSLGHTSEIAGEETLKKKIWTTPTHSKSRSSKIIKSWNQKVFMWSRDEKYQL